MGRKTHGSKHHVWPTSRGGLDAENNEVIIDPPKLHRAWHTLFGNDVVEEVIAKIEHVWQDEDGIIQEKYLLGDQREGHRDRRLAAWRTIFGNTRSARKAIEIIKKTFTKRA